MIATPSCRRTSVECGASTRTQTYASRVRRRPVILLCGLAVTAVVALTMQFATGRGLFAGHTEEWHWDKPAVVDGRTIHLTFAGGSCDGRRWVDVDETDSSVTLTVKIRDGRGSCAGVGLVGLRLDAELEKPLGDRTLIDGACRGSDEPARGNCPEPVQTGTCGRADYQVDMPTDDEGNVTLRVRIEHAAPGESWHFRWTFKDYDESRVDSSQVSADPDGQLVATRAMGRLPAEALKARRVEFAPVGGTSCEVRGHMPMAYGS